MPKWFCKTTKHFHPFVEIFNVERELVALSRKPTLADPIHCKCYQIHPLHSILYQQLLFFQVAILPLSKDC